MGNILDSVHKLARIIFSLTKPSYFGADSEIVALLSGSGELKMEKLHYRVIPPPGSSVTPGEIEQSVHRAEKHRYILHFDFTGADRGTTFEPEIARAWSGC